MSLKDKILKNSTIKEAAMINDSKVYGKKDFIVTDVPIINVAFSGKFDGGLVPGLTQFAGPSKHFKTGFSLFMAKAFQDKYEDGIILFYDTEFGAPESYFKRFGIDTDRVIHFPIEDIEQLKFEIMRQLQEIDKKDNILILIDSIGNIASKKEIEDALDQRAVADMTRAKQLKSFFRMVTPSLSIKDIPMLVVNHTYKEIGLYPKDIVSGGTGSYYSSGTIWVIGRQQDTTGQGKDKELHGYHFVINVEKSRYVKEGSKIPITVSWDEGIKKYSGMLELALKHGCVVKPKQGWYNSFIDSVVGEKSYRERDLLTNDDFWSEIFEKTDFREYIENMYGA